MSITRPPIIQKPWAESGDKNTIPVASQIGITDGAASFVTGFPPDTMIDIGDGGIAPDGLDMNGILNIITQHIRFINAGGNPRFDATLCTEIGGYPVGVVLQDNSGINLYRNVAANNTTDFNTTPASIGVSWIWLAGLTRNIVAGGGLTGGGSPATNDVTLNIGIPGTCGPSSTNTVTEDSHTHALNFPSAGTITAGGGLTGGGSLGGNVTLSLGVPSPCTGETDNSVVGDTHTHRIWPATYDTSGVAKIADNNTCLYLDSWKEIITPAGLKTVLLSWLGKRTFASSDYIRIPDVPGGLIFQWGVITALSTDATSIDISFPITFPNAVLHVGTTHLASQVDSNPVSSCSVKTGYTTSAFKLMQDTAKGYGVSEFWFAIGH